MWKKVMTAVLALLLTAAASAEVYEGRTAALCVQEVYAEGTAETICAEVGQTVSEGEALLTLLNDISVGEEDIVRYATRLFGTTLFDYIDCLLVARNHLYEFDVVTFDKPLLKHMM